MSEHLLAGPVAVQGNAASNDCEGLDACARVRPAWASADVFPFESHFLPIDGHRIHYVDAGHGPVLLLLHPAAAWSGYYSALIRELGDGVRCIAPDLPGFGCSTARAGYRSSLREHAAAIGAFIERLDLRDVTLLVHDSAGPIGLGVAARDPQRFRALVLTSTFAWPLTDYPAIRGILRVVGSAPFATNNAAVNLLPRVVVRFAPRRRRLTAAERTAITGAFPTWAHRRRITRLMGDLARDHAYLHDVETGLRAHLADRPALIMYGEHDPARKAGFDRRFEQLFARHRTIVIAGEQHFAHLAAADEMARHIRDFLGSQAERSVMSLSA